VYIPFIGFISCKLFVFVSEAEYAEDQKKMIIPLMMEKGFKPKGWLGLLKGSHKYFDFRYYYMVLLKNCIYK